MDRIEDAGYYSPFTTSATYVTGSDGTNYRKVELTAGGKPMSFADAVNYNKFIIKIAKQLKMDIAFMKLSQTNANLSLPELGLSAFSVGKLIKNAANMLAAYSDILDAVIKEKNTEIELIDALLGDAADTSEFSSGEAVIYVR